MKKWHLSIRNVFKSPQNPFLGAFVGFYGLYGPKMPFLWVPETSNWVLSCRVYLVLNGSNAKLAVLYTKCQIIDACVRFVNFWYHTIPKKLFSNRQIAGTFWHLWHLYIKSVSKSPKNPFVGAFMGFMGQKRHFKGCIWLKFK